MVHRSQVLAERRTLVTGATGGIGWAICQRLAQDGHRIALSDRDAEALATRTAELGPGHVALPADLTDPTAAADLPARAARALGGLETVVSNAGVTDTTGRAMIDLPGPDFDRLVALNLTAVQTIAEAALALLPRGGTITNIASGASFKPLPLRGPYSATKAGVAALTRALSQQTHARGVTINAVAPGYTRTPLVERLVAEGRVDLDAVARAIPLGRVAEPADIADAVAFCTGPDGCALTGRVLPVDGGSSAGAALAGVVTSPARGGTSLVVGALEMGEGWQNRDTLALPGALVAVIDARTLYGLSESRLAAARDTARACAIHPQRAAGFPLLFVTRTGLTPGDQAAGAALGMLARTLALELAPRDMRVNALLWNGDTRDPALAALCRFLTGPEGSYITGQAILAGLSPPGSETD